MVPSLQGGEGHTGVVPGAINEKQAAVLTYRDTTVHLQRADCLEFSIGSNGRLTQKDLGMPKAIHGLDEIETARKLY